MNKDTILKHYRQHTDPASAELSLAAKARVKERVFQALSGIEQAPLRRGVTARTWSLTALRFSVVTVFALVAITGTTYASAAAVPGDVLYPFKRVVEDTRLSFTSSPESKARLQVHFAEERIRELDKIETSSVSSKQQQIALPLKASDEGPATTEAPGTVAQSPTPSLPAQTNENRGATSAEARGRQTRTRAETRAREEILRAFTSLEQTQQSLTREGKNSQAKDLDETLTRLKNRANVKGWRSQQNRNAEDLEPEATSKTPEQDGLSQDRSRTLNKLKTNTSDEKRD